MGADREVPRIRDCFIEDRPSQALFVGPGSGGVGLEVFKQVVDVFQGPGPV